jgi:hypothetical protein
MFGVLPVAVHQESSMIGVRGADRPVFSQDGRTDQQEQKENAFDQSLDAQGESSPGYDDSRRWSETPRR